MALALVVTAFAVRLGWGLAADVIPGAAGFDDAAWYQETALTLARGDGYLSPFTALPTAAWPPGYPMILAVAYRTFAATPTTAVVLNAVLGALTCFFVWRLGRHFGGARLGLVAAAVLALFPSQIFFAALVLTETLFTCVVTGLLLAATRLASRSATARLGAWVLWGGAAGGAALIRAEAVVLVVGPVLALVTLGRFEGVLRVLAATLLGFTLALAPWALRNAREFGAFVPVSTGFGRTLWIGHNPIAHGGMSVAIQTAQEAAITAAGPFPPGPAGELAVERELRRQAIAFARANPGRELGLTLARAYHLFRGDHVWQAWYGPGTPRVAPSESARRRLGRAGNVYCLIVGLLALVGRLRIGRDPSLGWRLIDVLGLTWIGMFSVIYGDPRFHHVLVPAACLLAAAAVVRRRSRADANLHDAAAA